MYKKRKSIKVEGGIIFNNHVGFIIEKNTINERIIQIDKNGNESQRFNFINMNDVCGISFTNKFLIVAYKNDTTQFYLIDNDKHILNIDNEISTAFLKEDDVYIYINDGEVLYRFNKKIQCIEQFPMENKDLLLRCLLDGNLIFKLRGYLLCVYKSKDITLSWQLDLRPLFPNQENVRISEIKEYQGSLIVATTAAVLRLSVEDGSIIWISEGYARTIEIVGNTGYVCTSGSLFKVNLDNGEESGFGWGEYHKLPNFTYNGKDYWATGHRVVYHDGLLWYSVYSSGDSFLIAINPENGNYEWIHYVDTIGKTDEPQFFGDYMFLYDTEHTLHIYQKES